MQVRARMGCRRDIRKHCYQGVRSSVKGIGTILLFTLDYGAKHRKLGASLSEPQKLCERLPSLPNADALVGIEVVGVAWLNIKSAIPNINVTYRTDYSESTG